ncbi:LLM class flavin-dependent oxidoreductase [Labrys wisconsinensis]|uniref:Alkanesulfonate monooxygenase SsuD/methylene tetrahydromethanopterin reductase-like flavin-dependent oxidoreductase (Luciferase family) n=1 Tax=Labrys wisconsinensis TaxID=425677 RepID=A0ABU0JFB6_9HYPH|nr:LLM class flavin-dependent oxidoreductase [Labrys wisconsinensis]MDQ0472108.1 alkanesulfonate monooxygenase SsuD/methylene tetrahydromethanopterin reductase-like flavin-dependent oxidoreductase (luciferase family) [Labrys wisconsinensis]
MKFGLFNLMSLRDNPDGVRGVISNTRQMIALAEDIGFDIAWFAEHHFNNYSLSPSPLVMCAHFAGVTKKIRLGAGVVVLPLYHPMRVAQEIGLVDQLSDGRFVLGVGTGYQIYEFERFNSPIAQKTEVFLEYWKILEQALTTGHASLDGEFIKAKDTVFTLRPRQAPMPELFVTSVDPRILKAVSKYDATPFLTAGWRGTKTLIEMAGNARKAWGAAGLGHRPMPFALQQYIHVTDSKEEALEAAERARFVGRMVMALRQPQVSLEGTFLNAPPLPDEPPLETFRDNLIIGDAHYVAERMAEEVRLLNPVHYNCFFQFGDMPIGRALRSLERFGSDVVPLLERAVGPLDAIGKVGAEGVAAA